MNEDLTDNREDNVERYPAVTVRGLLFPEPFLVPEVVEKLIDYKPQENEIYIVTYPKCGTTWTQFLVWEILHKGAFPPSPNQLMFKYIPFLEYTGVDVIADLPEPKVMKTHLPFYLQPYNQLAKYIYIVRNPWDCCVSYYHHHCLDDALGTPKTFDDYFKLFVTSQLEWGDFFDHVLSWHKHRNDPNVLFLSYEDMKADIKKNLFKIAKFLGEQYYEDLQDEEVTQNCLKHSDFKFLKEMGMYFPKKELPHQSKDESMDAMKYMGEIDQNNMHEHFERVEFFRKGIVGDWKNYFSAEQIKLFNSYMMKKLKNTEMENFWKPVDEETSF